MEQQLLPRIKARLIIEMLGSPRAHVEKTLKDYVAKLKKEPSMQVLKEEYALAEKRDSDLYAMFVEIEAWFKDPSHLLAFCFDAMPSSVEILEPVELKMPGKEFEGLINDLQARLHTVDLALKNIKATNKILDNNAMNVLHNFIIYILKSGEKTSEEISRIIGFPLDKIDPYLEKLIADKKVKRNGTKYSA